MSKVKKTDVKVKPVPAAKVPKNLEDLYKFIAGRLRSSSYHSHCPHHVAANVAYQKVRDIEKRLFAEVDNNPELVAAKEEEAEVRKVADKTQRDLEKKLEKVYVRIKAGRNLDGAADELVALANEVLGLPADATTPGE